MRIAVLASLSGTNAQAIIEASRQGRLDAEVAVVLTNRPEAGVIERARRLGIPVEVVPSKGAPSREEYDRKVLEVLGKYNVDIIALAGWMRILSEPFLEAYRWRIINLHPAILPSFPGGTGIDDAFCYGVKLAGCSVHLVSPVLDGGPIVIQAAVPADCDRDTLEARIHKMEHLIFPQALQWMVQGRISVEGRVTSLAAPGKPVTQTSVVDGCLICPPLENFSGTKE